jgi:uncharacterized membrane protein YjgN (DUF898 family)
MNNLEYLPFEFRGDAKEFFKIWIVNIFLSVITLGIYSAWAKVRTNRYIYRNTYLNGTNFEFNANPKRILYGRLIVFSFYALFLFSTDVINNPTLASMILILFLLFLPWLIRQAISFRLKSASYRNIHFKYKGKAKDFYKIAFFYLIVFLVPLFLFGMLISKYQKDSIIALIALLLIVVFYITAFPILYKNYKSIVINNSYYGKSQFNFNAQKKDAIKLFFKIGLILIVILIIVSSLLVAFGFIFKAIGTTKSNILVQSLISIITAIFYLATIAFFKGLYDGYISNFIRNNTTLNKCKFKSDIKPFRLGFISFINILATLFTLGLAYPWAKMRYLKYKANHTYFKCCDYESFISDGKEQANTIGEETLDFFDIDIGI